MPKYLSEVYGEGGIYAKCVIASICNGIPIYTIETCAPKFIDAEFEKHRMFSSNSSSSRAIPYKELDDIYLPFNVRYNQRGMQGNTLASDVDKALFCSFIEDLYDYVNSQIWPWAIGYNPIHKQHLNRYIEPWMFQKKVVTATEWDNFFKLRLHPNAQPEIQELARCMKEAIELVKPTPLSLGEWHLPYIAAEDRAVSITQHQDYLQLVSAGRCARVSYDNIHSKKPPEKLAADLLIKKHMTPFEHQATPMDDLYTDLDVDWQQGVTHQDRLNQQWSANFRGWIQYRQIL